MFKFFAELYKQCEVTVRESKVYNQSKHTEADKVIATQAYKKWVKDKYYSRTLGARSYLSAHVDIDTYLCLEDHRLEKSLSNLPYEEERKFWIEKTGADVDYINKRLKLVREKAIKEEMVKAIVANANSHFQIGDE